MIFTFGIAILAEADTFWNSNLASALIGAVSAVAVMAITEAFSRQRVEIDTFQSQVDDFRMALNEVKFYIPILKLADCQLMQAQREMSELNENFALPSFRFDTTLLQSLRRSLSRNSADPNLILLLTKCAYEMEHLQTRLDAIEKQITIVRQTAVNVFVPAILRKTVLPMVEGTATLAKTTVTLFEESAPKLEAAILVVEDTAQRLRAFNLLPR